MIKDVKTNCKLNMYNKINLALYIIFSFLMVVIIGTAIKYPANNLISWQMLLGTLVGTALLLIAGNVWNLLYCRIGRNSICYWICLILFGIGLYVFSLGREDNRYTMTDYIQIYSAAMDIAAGKEISNSYYFLIYSNNQKPMLLLSLLFRAADFFHLPEFQAVLAINVIQILLVVWGCGYLSEHEGDSRWRFPILVAFVFFLPIWGMPSVFYTDSMSFGLGILALALLKKTQNSVGRSIWCWAACAAFIVVLAISWKITAIIPVIAAIIITIWQKRKCNWKTIIGFLIFFALFSLIMNIWTNKYELVRQSKTTANPLISWVALGMKEDGSWNLNREFVGCLNNLSTTQEKSEYTLEYIKENKESFWDVDHLIRKSCRNFANGNMGVCEFMFIEDDDGTLIWNLFSPWGKYYWRASQYCFCYLNSIYVLLLLGMLYCVKDLFRGERISPLLMIDQLSFFGIFLFLMIWEANSRQLYNQMPGLILGAVLSLREILLHKSIKNNN